MSLTYVLPLVIAHNMRLFLQDRLSWELIRGYILKSVELLIALVCLEGFDTIRHLFLSFQDAALSVATLICIVGAVAMLVEATADFLSLLQFSPELAVLFFAYQWLTTPEEHNLHMMLLSALQCVEVTHIAMILIRLIILIATDHLQILAMLLLQKVTNMGATTLGSYGLDAANMSPVTFVGATIDLVFICGAVTLTLKMFLALVAYVGLRRTRYYC